MAEFQVPAPRLRFGSGLSVASINKNETQNLYKEIFEDRVYLPPSAGFRFPLRPVVLDLGANIGLFSLFAAQEWPGAVIHAFEPVPAVCAVLVQNLAGVRGTHVHQVAAGDDDRDTAIRYYPGYTMMSGIDADPRRDLATVQTYVANVAGGDEAGSIAADVGVLLAPRFEQVRVPVVMRSVASIVRQLGLKRIDFLKVDVEGSELAVMRGLDEQAWSGLRNAVVEVEDRSGELEEITRLCEEHGMVTAVAQLPEYRNTDLNMLYAWRT